VQEPWVIVTAQETDSTSDDSSGSTASRLKAWGVAKKVLPGKVSVSWQVAGSVLDPFNSMPIEMPLKSKELFTYCEFLPDFLCNTHSSPKRCPAPADRWISNPKLQSPT
jgi:hypothetical protein